MTEPIEIPVEHLEEQDFEVFGDDNFVQNLREQTGLFPDEQFIIDSTIIIHQMTQAVDTLDPEEVMAINRAVNEIQRVIAFQIVKRQFPLWDNGYRQREENQPEEVKCSGDCATCTTATCA